MRHARLQLLAAAVLFSTGGAAIKATSLSSWEVACYRSGIAALTLLLLVPEARRGLGRAAFGVGLAFAATVVLFVSSSKLTTSANAIFLQSTAPLYLLLLSPLLLGERARARDLLFMVGIALGLAAFFVGSEQPRSSAPDPFTGDLLGVASGVCWAFTVLGLRAVGRRPGAAGMGPVVAGNIIACVVCLPFALGVIGAAGAGGAAGATSAGVDVSSVAATGQGAAALAQVAGASSAAGSGWLDFGLLLYLGVVQIGLAYLLVTLGLRHVPALESSLLLMAEPALNPLWAWLAQDEVPGPWALAGGALILGSTLAKALVDAPRGIVGRMT